MGADVGIERVLDIMPAPAPARRGGLDWHAVVFPFYLPVLFVLATLVPETAWPALSRLFVLPSRLISTGLRRRRDTIERQLAGRVDNAAAVAADAAVDFSAGFHEARMHCLRAIARGWRPEIDLAGREHLDTALARGRGVILWVENFAFAALVTKMALHRAGFAIHHLSRPTHGFTHSPRLGPLLNPLWVRVEARYLADRIVIRGGHAGTAATALARRLKAGQAVSITVTPEARELARAPFLDGALALPAGPAKLAARTGAALLPVFAVRVAPRRYAVTIGSPLETTDPQTAIAGYAQRLAPYVVRWPGQYHGW